MPVPAETGAETRALGPAAARHPGSLARMQSHVRSAALQWRAAAWAGPFRVSRGAAFALAASRRSLDRNPDGCEGNLFDGVFSFVH